MAGTNCRHSVKIRSVNFCVKQLKRPVCRLVELKIANHSVRKTSISRLLDGAPENFVAQLSGHKNLQSLSSYKSASITHQRKMSDILQQLSRSTSSVNVPNVVPFGGTSSLQSSFAQQSSFSFQDMPHRGFFASANIGSISNCARLQPCPACTNGSIWQLLCKSRKTPKTGYESLKRLVELFSFILKLIHSLT